MSSESSLLERCRRFDERALAEIYDRWSPELYYYAIRLLGDTDLAEECVSETFSRFLHALHAGGGPRTHLRAYLYRVAHNWITDHYRRRPPEDPLREEVLTIERDDGPDRLLQRDVEIQALRFALAQLTPEQRQVIVLKFIEGWSNKEIALSMDKSVGAVKSLQHRGLAALERLILKMEQTI